MKILSNEKRLHLRVVDEHNRIIYDNQCINKCHFECVKYFLIQLKHGATIDNSILKPLTAKKEEIHQVSKRPIFCRHCEKIAYYVEDLIYIDATTNLNCPKCGEPVIYNHRIMF